MKISHIQEYEGLDEALDILFYKKTNLGWTDKNIYIVSFALWK